MEYILDLNVLYRLANQIARITTYAGFVDSYGFIRKQLFKSQVAILSYHRVGDPNEFPWNVPMVTTEDFESQMKYLIKSFEIISIDAVIKCLLQGDYLPKKAVIITFDDGYKGNFTYAYPILKKYNMTANINVSTAHIDTGNIFWWDKIKWVLWNTKLQHIDLGKFGIYRLHSLDDRIRLALNLIDKLKKLSEKEKNLTIKEIIRASGVRIPLDISDKLILSWNDIREMQIGGITFGAHSLTHPNLTKIPYEAARVEISQSKKDLQEKLDQEITLFAYPNGDFNNDTIELVKDEGFDCGLTTIPMMFNQRIDPYKLGRIPGGWNLNTLKLFLCGVYPDLWSIYHYMKGIDSAKSVTK